MLSLKACGSWRALAALFPVLAILCLGSAGCRTTPHHTVSNNWAAFVQQFLEDYFLLNPDMAVSAGRHEFDGQLPDWSQAGLQRMVDFYKSARQRALDFDPTGLSETEQFEREYFIFQMNSELFWLEKAEAPFRNPQFYQGFGGLDPSVYVTLPYASLKTRMKAYTSYAENVPNAVSQIKMNLRTPMPETYVDLGITLFGGLAAFMEADIPAVFAPVKNQPLQDRFQTANEASARALRDLEQWFESQKPTATSDYALGADLFLQMLRDTEGVDVSLARLKEVGERDLERNLIQLTNACHRLAPGKSVQECLAMVKANKPADGPVQGARNQLAGIKQFLVDKDLVTIPSKEEALVDESPPYMRWNMAYINIPGPYEKGLPSTYYIAPPDPSWTAEEQEDYLPGESDLLFVSVHEVWPGHFLQFLHSNRASSKFGQLFVGYAFAEGWAHYTEEMMWEAGLGDGDPDTHIGQLLNALLRNVRYLSAIGLHTGTMTVEESEKLFLEKGFQDPGNARQQAARGTFDPGYLNYTLGKLMIMKLREDWTASRGGDNAWGRFHDTFLSYGGPPIPLVRKAMLGEDSGPAL